MGQLEKQVLYYDVSALLVKRSTLRAAGGRGNVLKQEDAGIRLHLELYCLMVAERSKRRSNHDQGIQLSRVSRRMRVCGCVATLFSVGRVGSLF